MSQTAQQANDDTRPGVGLRSDGLPDIDWCEVPGGTFITGSDRRIDPAARDNETPAREVTMSHAYKIARYPVTHAQFQAFIDTPNGLIEDCWWENMPERERISRFGSSGRELREMDAQQFPYPNHPRDSVSWYQAVAFCRWLTHQYRDCCPDLLNGNEIRLPTEQEWELAARGGDNRIYPWGNVYLPGYANVDETGLEGGAVFLERTTPVGLYPQGVSPYGVLDMSGNVLEWCLTNYDEPDNNAVDSSGDPRVLRGGSCLMTPDNARCAYRGMDYPYRRSYSIGFRVMMALPCV